MSTDLQDASAPGTKLAVPTWPPRKLGLGPVPPNPRSGIPTREAFDHSQLITPDGIKRTIGVGPRAEPAAPAGLNQKPAPLRAGAMDFAAIRSRGV